MSVKVGGMSFDTLTDAARYQAGEWLSAGGLNDRQYIEDTFLEMDDDALANEVFCEWDAPEGVTEEDLAEAFGYIRRDPVGYFGWEE